MFVLLLPSEFSGSAIHCCPRSDLEVISEISQTLKKTKNYSCGNDFGSIQFCQIECADHYLINVQIIVGEGHRGRQVECELGRGLDVSPRCTKDPEFTS
jgi:hypothetical protein